MVHVLSTTTSASRKLSVRSMPSASRRPAMRSESCSFIWHPNVRTTYLRVTRRGYASAGTGDRRNREASDTEVDRVHAPCAPADGEADPLAGVAQHGGRVGAGLKSLLIARQCRRRAIVDEVEGGDAGHAAEELLGVGVDGR